ncbi:hypothetical protein ACVC7V_09605 [Hydrogenophaga sp. A37]|uniref:hypothetical protein n=1 Tax=Hydrogenophaga sp. A37 TaxID=1945864 RepID=UPI00117BCA62|nr:hypothetical protein [Hydrogenophaga sp. A37]
MTTQKAVLAVVLGLPAWVHALDLREPPLQAMTVVPSVSSESGDARPTHRLRDALRQPVSADESSGKPYRLSVEERQRLREQLRGQTAEAKRNK